MLRALLGLLPKDEGEIYWNKAAMLRNGERTNKDHYKHVISDSQGRFSLEADSHQAPLLALGQQGIAIKDLDEFNEDGSLVLRPWATVTGSLHIGTGPAVSTELRLTHANPRLRPSIRLMTSTATTDAQGRFTFARVYPGSFTLYHQTYEVDEGQILELKLGGSGRTVMGQALSPVPVDVPTNAFFEIVALRDRFPYAGPAIRAHMDTPTVFRVDNLEPGRYAVRGKISVKDRDSALNHHERSARMWHEFEVPETSDQATASTGHAIGEGPLLSKLLSKAGLS